jgi:outer membrane protein assembly factor BamA
VPRHRGPPRLPGASGGGARRRQLRRESISLRLNFAIARLLALAVVLLGSPGDALAVEEIIRDIRVVQNARTEEETVLALAGIAVGDVMERDTLESVRERLNTSGLFSNVNVFWVRRRGGVRIEIVVREKFPWAPVPTFSYTPGNISGGLLLPHGNLFGRGKRGIVGGRVSTADSLAILAYRDPAVWGSWLFLQIAGVMQDQTIPEYSNQAPGVPHPVRETNLRAFVFNTKLGVAWFGRLRTSVGWGIERARVRWVRGNEQTFPGSSLLPAPAEGGLRGYGEAELTLDFRAREHAVMWGTMLSLSVDQGAPHWGGDRRLRYWKARANIEQGIKLFRKHNLILTAGGFAGRDMPFWVENSAGGTNLRGYLHRQFAGDTHLRTQLEYHFPLFSISKLDVRGVVFNDAAAIWYRRLPPVDSSGQAYVERGDGRNFLPPAQLRPGFDRNRDVHTSVGGGLRFFLRSVAIPLVGVDAGYGLPDGPVRMVLIVGV